MSQNTTSSRPGFTLIETIAMVSLFSILVAVVMPSAHHARSAAQAQSSANNLRQIGTGASQYAKDNRSRIFSYTWESNRGSQPRRYEIPGGYIMLARNDTDAARIQSAEILRRRTGRLYGEHAIEPLKRQVPHKRLIGLVLSDYLGHDFPDPLFIDPADANQVKWAEDPLLWGDESSVPYATVPSDPEDQNLRAWTDPTVRQSWAFTSSYQVTQFAWHADGTRRTDSFYKPYAGSPHLIDTHLPETNGRSRFPVRSVQLSRGRRLTQVRSPALKVYFFEEFDREQEGSPYFAYDHARPEKLMFDGSVNNWASGDSGDSYSPADRTTVWKQTYVPLDTFPQPVEDIGADELLNMRYRWTKRGLAGFDYTIADIKKQDP